MPLILLCALCVVWATACDIGGSGSGGGQTSASLRGSSDSGDIKSHLGAEIRVAAAIVVVRALEATFQPAMPEQRMSEETPSAPAAGESFYQAYVRVKNLEETPLRVDPADFACAIGNVVVAIEPTRTGPFPRSLLKNTSMDLLLTFEGPAGFTPMLVYSPSWYDGVITVTPEAEPSATTTS